MNPLAKSLHKVEKKYLYSLIPLKGFKLTIKDFPPIKSMSRSELYQTFRKEIIPFICNILLKKKNISQLFYKAHITLIAK